MDTERPHTQIEPDALDQAIQAALNVDPSPEFLARVRARIADERPARSWRFTIVPVFAAAATLAILALVVMNTSRRPAAPPAGAATATGPAEAPVSGSTRSASVPESAPTASRSPEAAAAEPRIPQPRPEPPGRPAAASMTSEARGLRALVDRIGRGSVIVVADDSQSSAQQAAQIRGVEVAPLTIPSISVEPIAPVAQ